MDGSEAYLNLCRDQLLNLNNLYLICYHNNLQMHSNFERFLNQRNTIPQHGFRFNYPENRTNTNNWHTNNWHTNNISRNHRASPLPQTWNIPNPPSLFTTAFNDNITNGRNNRFSWDNRTNTFHQDNTHRSTNFTRRRNRQRRNSAFNLNRNNRRTPFWSISQPFTNTERVLNHSLYDSIPNNPLPNEDYLRETTNDTWHNTRLLLNLQENSRCAITQQEFNENEIVTRIYSCNHVFNHDALLRWFQRDTRCPICRYNLLNNSQNNQQDNSNNNIDNSTNSNTPLTWRVPLVSPLNTPRENTANNTANDTANNTANEQSSIGELFNSITDELEQNITNTLMDNSSNLMNISNQVANSLMNAIGATNAYPNNDFLTTEFSFNLQPNYTGYDAFNIAAPCSNIAQNNNTTNTVNNQSTANEESTANGESKVETALNQESKDDINESNNGDIVD